MTKASRRLRTAPADRNTPRNPVPALVARNTTSLPPLPAVVDPMAAVPVRHVVSATAEFLPPGDDLRAYAMHLHGNCLAPVAADGSMAIVSPASPLIPGRLVALFFKDSRPPQIKRLVALPPAAMLAAMDNPASTVRAGIMVEMLNPPRMLTFNLSDLSAIHAVSGVMPPGTFEARRTTTPAAAAGPTDAAGADAVLLRLCGQYAGLDVMLADAEKRHGKDDAYTTDAGRLETDPLVGQQQALVPQMVAAGCTTPAGVVALAGLMAGTDCERDYPAHGAHERFPAMILRALNAGAVPAPAKPAAHPDEALIRLGEQFVVAHRISEAAWEAAADEPQERGPLTQEACWLSDVLRPIAAAIEQLRATTHTGLIVKLRVMMWHRGGVHEADRQSPYPYDRTLADMADDLAAMDVTMTGAGVRT